MIPAMAQVSETGTEAEQAPAPRRRRRGLELGGLVIGIITRSDLLRAHQRRLIEQGRVSRARSVLDLGRSSAPA